MRPGWLFACASGLRERRLASRDTCQPVTRLPCDTNGNLPGRPPFVDTDQPIPARSDARFGSPMQFGRRLMVAARCDRLVEGPAPLSCYVDWVCQRWRKISHSEPNELAFGWERSTLIAVEDVGPVATAQPSRVTMVATSRLSMFYDNPRTRQPITGARDAQPPTVGL
jgi:hypothetical protein